VVDDLDRALANIPEAEDTSGSLVEGVQMVHRKFLQALESQGAKSFYPAGELFDPTTHEALMEMPVDDVKPGHIAQVFQRGWLLNDRLLRPAKVIIAKEP
jgi:molecular chaperone GrpE